MIDLLEIKDIETLLSWRVEVIEHVFGQNADEDLIKANEHYYKEHLKNGSHQAFIVRMNNDSVGCGAICYTDELPSPDNTTGKCAYLMNIYVREPFRNHGVGHIIVKHLIEQALKCGCKKIYLETTSEGRPVYTSLGFKNMPDMMKYYDTED